LAERWRLPESIANVQSFSNSFDSNSQLPLLAANLAWQAMRDSQAREMEVLISLCADLTHLDEDMVRSRLHQEMAAAARLACAAGLPYMADQFLLVAEDASKPLATAPAKQSNKPPAPPRPENPQTSEAAKALPKEPPAPIAPSTTQPDKKQTSPSADKPQQKPLAKPSTQAKSAATTAKAPRRPSSDKNASSTEKKAETTETSPPISPRPAKPSPAKQKQPASFQAILGQAMRNLHSEWRLERIMFAMLTVDRQQLRSRFVMEKTTSNLGQFSVPASSRNLFSLLIAKPYTLWVNKDNQAKYLPHIPESAASLLKGGDFFVTCVLVDEKPIGILYADGNGLALDDKQFDAFKKVMEQTQHALKKKN
jgi:outer membrane biosynthesis protein TonB